MNQIVLKLAILASVLGIISLAIALKGYRRAHTDNSGPSISKIVTKVSLFNSLAVVTLSMSIIVKIYVNDSPLVNVIWWVLMPASYPFFLMGAVQMFRVRRALAEAAGKPPTAA
jgi:uncharacterized membrane protein